MSVAQAEQPKKRRRAAPGPQLERQREGIAKATSEDRYKGRAPPARTKPADIGRLAREGAKREDIAKRLGTGSPPSIACWQPREPRQQ